MMRRLLFLGMTLCAVLSVSAQTEGADTDGQQQTSTVIFGYFSYGQTLRQMPEYAGVQQQMAELKAQYEAEAQRVEKDFNEKYEAFLEGQKDFPRTILLKRQTELQELMQKNVAFRQQAREELKKAEEEALKPLQQRLNDLLGRLAMERGYALILNTDANACPFVHPQTGEYIGDVVMERLNAEYTIMP